MSGSVLSRISQSHEPYSVLSERQQEIDRLVTDFGDRATDWRSLAAVTAGGLAYRFGRLGMLGWGEGGGIRALSLGTGLAAEVSTFEITHRFLPSLGEENGDLWRWSGSRGLGQGLLNSAVTFGSLKACGSFARGQNIFLRHGIQDAAMVAGHHLAYGAGAGESPRGDLLQQFLHAEATNLQLGAGLALGGTLTGGSVQGLERALDLSLAAPSPAVSEKSRAFDFKQRLLLSLAFPLTSAGGLGAIGPILLGRSSRKRGMVEWPLTSEGVFAHGRSVRTALEKETRNPKATRLLDEILSHHDQLHPRQMHFLLAVFEADLGNKRLSSVRQVKDRLLEEKNLLVDLYTLNFKAERSEDLQEAQAWEKASESGSLAFHRLFYPAALTGVELKNAKKALFSISKNTREGLTPGAVVHLYDTFRAELSSVSGFARLRRLIAHYQYPEGFDAMKARVDGVIRDWNLRRGSLPTETWRQSLFTEILLQVEGGALSHGEARRRLDRLEKDLLPGPADSIPTDSPRENPSPPIPSAPGILAIEGPRKSPLPPRPSEPSGPDPFSELEKRATNNPKWGEIRERAMALCLNGDEKLSESLTDLLDVMLSAKAAPYQVRALLDFIGPFPTAPEVEALTHRLNVERPLEAFGALMKEKQAESAAP